MLKIVPRCYHQLFTSVHKIVIFFDIHKVLNLVSSISDKTKLFLTHKELFLFITSLSCRVPGAYSAIDLNMRDGVFPVPSYLFQPVNLDCQTCLSLVSKYSSIVCMFEEHLCWEF